MEDSNEKVRHMSKKSEEQINLLIVRMFFFYYYDVRRILPYISDIVCDLRTRIAPIGSRGRRYVMVQLSQKNIFFWTNQCSSFMKKHSDNCDQ